MGVVDGYWSDHLSHYEWLGNVMRTRRPGEQHRNQPWPWRLRRWPGYERIRERERSRRYWRPAAQGMSRSPLMGRPLRHRRKPQDHFRLRSAQPVAQLSLPRLQRATPSPAHCRRESLSAPLQECCLEGPLPALAGCTHSRSVRRTPTGLRRPAASPWTSLDHLRLLRLLTTQPLLLGWLGHSM